MKTRNLQLVAVTIIFILAVSRAARQHPRLRTERHAFHRRRLSEAGSSNCTADKKPFVLISWDVKEVARGDANLPGIRLLPESMARLREIEGPIACIAVIGPCESASLHACAKWYAVRSPPATEWQTDRENLGF